MTRIWLNDWGWIPIITAIATAWGLRPSAAPFLCAGAATVLPTSAQNWNLNARYELRVLMSPDSEDKLANATIHIGTSGWHYKHWIGPIYPREMRPSIFLDFYAQRFRSVEINASFYKLPLASTLEKWRETTPSDFVFAAKASRYLTHRRKLKDPEKSSRLFFEVITVLGTKLGPVLVQLPPRWRVNLERLEEFLEVVPKRYRLAFEFRDESWLKVSVYKILERHGAALCIYDFDGRQSPVQVTAPFVYVRLHGPEGKYRGRYDKLTLKAWARRFRGWREEGLEGYCYFDNDEAGFAFKDASRLSAMVEDEHGQILP